MTLSERMESQIDTKITKFGNTAVIQKQTATYDTYNQTEPNWTNSTTVSTTAIIVSFNPKNANGEEYKFYTQGLIREDDYVGFFKATEILEETVGSTTSTRYIITYNSQNYEIVKIFPPELQDNVLVKKCILRFITN